MLQKVFHRSAELNLMQFNDQDKAFAFNIINTFVLIMF